MWKLFRRPAPADPEVFEEPPNKVVVPGVNVVAVNRQDVLAALLAGSCADSSETVDKFLQLYDRAQKYLKALDERSS